MNTKITVISLGLAALAACKTPLLMLPDGLKNNSSPMEAKGRQGLQFNQVIRYGDYYTSKAARGWTKTSDLNFVVRFRKAEEKLSFTQFAPGDQHTEVFAVSRFRDNELPLLKGFLSYVFQYENAFAGSMVPNDNLQNAWEFIVHNPEASLPKDADCGLARNLQGREILIRGVKHLEGREKLWNKFSNYGFEFIENGKSVGAVEVLNNGRVWLRNDLDAETKLVLSAISTSLLLRHNAEDQAAK